MTAEDTELRGSEVAPPDSATVQDDDGGPAPETGLIEEAPADAGASAPADGETPAPADGETPAPADGETSAPVGPQEVSAAITVGRAIADWLRLAGVRFAFTVPGESFLGLLDALEPAGIRTVATRHEGGAAFMAEAYGQLTGRPAACLATRAVGASNLAIGIHTARQDSTPMFAIIGQVTRANRGREAFQEANAVESIGRLAKWAVEIDRANDVDTAMNEAVRQALSGRPGPVLISIPEDVLDETLPEDRRRPAGPSRVQPPRPDPAHVRAVLQLLAGAERPVILAGAGVLRARTSSDLVRLAELLSVPVVASWRRGDAIPNDHPLFLGTTGYGSPATVRARLETADALLVLGARLNEIASFGYSVPRPGLRWAHVDLEPRRQGNLPAADLAIEADARSFVRACVQRLSGAVLDAQRVQARQAANEDDRAAWEAASVVDAGDWSGPGVHPGRVVATLRRVLPDDAIVTTDAGNFSGWLARGFRFRRPGTFIGPTSGAMGYGLPAAIAAALLHRERAVVALAGDGGFAMTMAELETAVREHLRVVCLVFDNERYGTIRMHQDERGTEAPAGTDLGPIDFAAIARALGGRGVKVDADAGFESALRQALATDRPTVIQLSLDRAWVSVDRTPLG